MINCFPRILRSLLIAPLFLAGLAAHAAAVTGTVSDKTTGKPSPGDAVELIDVGAGMSTAATATTDAKGHYSLLAPGMGPYLIRVNHQGATYFIAAPQGGASGDVTVYDVAAHVDGVAIDADMILFEAAGGSLRIQERYLVRNTSLPPKAQFSSNTFEVVIPPDAELDGASATRPGGLGTNTRLQPLAQKGHYTYTIPIQPDQGEKETLFELQYHLPYNGKVTFTPHLMMPADNFVVYVPKSMKFSAGEGFDFQPTQDDPRVQTYIHKNLHPGQALSFTISGEGQMPRDQQRPAAGQTAAAAMGGGAAQEAAPASTPGGGIGVPIGTPDPLTKYKWWILGSLALILVVAAVFLLRNRTPALAGISGSAQTPIDGDPTPPYSQPSETMHGENRGPAAQRNSPPPAPRSAPAPSGSAALLDTLKDELFSLESEKLNGTLSETEYVQARAGLEAVLKRALKKA